MLSGRTIRRWLIGTAVLAVVAVAAGYDWSGAPGEARLVAFESLANTGTGETCEWEVAAPQYPSYAASFAAPGAAAMQFPDADARLGVAKRQPLTFIQDPYPSWSSIAVDPGPQRDRGDRREPLPHHGLRPHRGDAGVGRSHDAEARHQRPEHAYAVRERCLHRPPTGEIYVINNDTVHNTTIYGRKANGDSPPDREFIVAATATSAPRWTSRGRRCTSRCSTTARSWSRRSRRG